MMNEKEKHMYTWDQLQKANKICSSIDVKGKEYVEVNQRIKAFRSICPGGSITTEMLSNENGVCVFRATVCDENMQILGTGTAYEKETSSFINKTSYIENCETSAVGRALGMCGFGIDTSIASAEEVQNAIKNQGEQPKQELSNGKQLTPREQVIARLAELNINVHAYAKANNLTAKSTDEDYLRCLKELTNA
jgi:hypothetical protein